MKNYILIQFLTFTILQTSYSQGLFFESKIYVTDSRGNKDSLGIGLQPNLTKQYNPELGELIDTSPFDSVLEVRGAFFKNYNHTDSVFFTRRIVNAIGDLQSFGNKQCYRLQDRIFLFIHAKYPPVTISWDRDIWAEECTAGSWITTWWLSETVTGWYNSQDTSTYKCMGLNSSVTWTLPYTKPQPDEWKWANWYRVHEIEGGTMDTIPFIQIAPKYRYFFDTPCWVPPVSTNDVFDSTQIEVFPNPSFDHIYFSGEFNIQYIEVYAADGRLEMTIPYVDGADVSKLSAGLKMLILYKKDGKLLTSKFVKF